MIKSMLYGCLLLLCLGCLEKDVPALGDNPLSNPDVPPFVFVSQTATNPRGVFVDLRVDFSNIYPQLNPAQQEQILGIDVNFTNNIDLNVNVAELPADQTFFTVTRARTGVEICYNLSFLIAGGVSSDSEVEMCVRP